MKVGGVAQGDAVQGEVVGLAHDHQARASLELILHLGFFRQVPPGDVGPVFTVLPVVDQRGATATVDGPVAHDARAGRLVGQDKRLAFVSCFRDDTTASRRDVVVAWISRGEQGRAGGDEQGHAGFQPQWTRKKHIFASVGFELDGGAGCTRVERCLDAVGVRGLLGGVGQHALGGGEFRGKNRACRGNARLFHITRILTVGSATGEGDGPQQEQNPDPTDGGPSAGCARIQMRGKYQT